MECFLDAIAFGLISKISHMPVGENHVEEEVEANWPKKEKCCYKPPKLEFSYDLSRVEVKLKSRDHIQLNG